MTFVNYQHAALNLFLVVKIDLNGRMIFGQKGKDKKLERMTKLSKCIDIVYELHFMPLRDRKFL